MNGTTIALTLAGCAGYIFLMSLMGKWLAHGSKQGSTGAALIRADGPLLGESQPEIRETIAS